MEHQLCCPCGADGLSRQCVFPAAFKVKSEFRVLSVRLFCSFALCKCVTSQSFYTATEMLIMDIPVKSDFFKAIYKIAE